MTLKPNSAALTVLLGLTVGLGPLSTDLYLPVLPDIAAYFGTPAAAAQATLSAFMLGFACGQIFVGPLSDRLGRRSVLMAGYAVFVVVTALCAAAPSIEVLIAARFFQAMAASAPFILARAVVRDLHDGVEAARRLALLSVVAGTVPTLAPVLGGIMALAFDWRIQFVFMGAVGVVNCLALYRWLPETLRRPAAERLSPSGIVAALAAVGRVPVFRAYTALVVLSFAGMFAIISASPFVLQQVYGLNPFAFGVAFGGTAACYVAGSLAGAQIVRRRGIDGVLVFGVGALALAGLVMVAAILSDTGFVGIVLAMMIYGAGLGMTFPPAMAGALAPFPHRSGSASSLTGFLQTSIAALTGLGVGLAVDDSAWPMAVPVCLCGALAVTVFVATARLRRTGSTVVKPAD